MTDTRRLAELGMVPPLATEVASQINGAVAAKAAVAALVALTDSSGGTPSNTIVDVPATYTEATLANQIASLTAKVNAIIAALKG
jgi:mannose/fructose-specific phosphotransferase system component IIA